MIQSTATKYALRALCHLAEQPPATRRQAREIADEVDVPYHYLSKILQDLAKKGILASTKGPGGGFELGIGAADISLYRVIEAVEGPISDEECMLGLEVCSDDAQCPMHTYWKRFRADFRERMRSISLADVVIAAEKKRRLREAAALPV